MLETYEIIAEKSHGVYNSFIIALGRAYDADYLIKKEDDFDDLCTGEDVKCVNSISSEKREKLTLIDG